MVSTLDLCFTFVTFPSCCCFCCHFLHSRYFSDITLYGLEVLQLVTLSPLPRRAITAAGGGSSGSSSSSRGGQAGGSRVGMATLLHAASTGNTQPFYGLADPEVCGCVGVWVAWVWKGLGAAALRARVVKPLLHLQWVRPGMMHGTGAER